MATPRNDEATVRQLVAKNINVVYRIVRDTNIRKDNPLYEDAVQAGLERLVQAAQRYDDTRSVPFANFAWPAVSSGVKDLLGSQQLVYEPLKNINGRASAAAKFKRMSHAEKEATYGPDGSPEPIYRGSQVPLETFGERAEDHRRQPVPAELTTEDLTIASIDGSEDEAEFLRNDLDLVAAKLPTALHDTLVLRLQGYSVAEIAARMGCARSTVQTRLKRAITAVREVYGFEPGV